MPISNAQTRGSGGDSSRLVTIDRTEISALIFDLDGTMVDNMSFHYLAWQSFLSSIGLNWSLEEIHARIWGKNEDIFERLFPGRYTREEVLALSNRKELKYIELFRPHVRFIDGLAHLLRQARALDVRLAIATAAPKICVDFLAEALCLTDYVDTIVHADQVVMSKPHPETFLTAASQLGVSPKKCLVFEDAPVGLRASESAGMTAYVLLTTHTLADFKEFQSIRGFLRNYENVGVA